MYEFKINKNCISCLLSQDNTYVDYIQFDFGPITNLNRQNPNHKDPDLLQLHFSAEMLADHPAVGNGTEFLVQAGVRYELVDKDVLWAVEIPVYSVDDQTSMYSEPEKVSNKTVVAVLKVDIYLIQSTAQIHIIKMVEENIQTKERPAV